MIMLAKEESENILGSQHDKIEFLHNGHITRGDAEEEFELQEGVQSDFLVSIDQAPSNPREQMHN